MKGVDLYSLKVNYSVIHSQSLTMAKKVEVMSLPKHQAPKAYRDKEVKLHGFLTSVLDTMGGYIHTPAGYCGGSEP